MIFNFVQFHLDNADFYGHTHILLLVGFQKGSPEKSERRIQVDLSSTSIRLQNNNFGELLPFTKRMTKSFQLKEEHHQLQTTISQHIAKDYQIRTTRVWEFCKSVEIMKDGNKQANEQDLLKGIGVEEEIEIDILK